MFGEKALELIREFHRNKDGNLVPYNVGLIYSVSISIRNCSSCKWGQRS